MTADLFVSHAQTMEDVMLWRALRDRGPGFYIEARAADASQHSVTRAFYERGWRGIDIVPQPERAARLRRTRPRDLVVESALADAPSTAKPGHVPQPPVTTLASLCREHVHGDVHFLRIDAAGAEAAVLRGADFRHTRPWILVVQAVDPITGAATAERWEALLHEASYRFVWFDGLNRFYVAQEHHLALAPHFQAPPNPFDRYTIASAATEHPAGSPHHRAGEHDLAVTPQRHRSAKRALYALVRPVLRPLAWRLRTFLIGPVRDDIAELRAQQDALIDRLEHLGASRPAQAVDPELAKCLEQLLLTLAVHHDRAGSARPPS
ncbi:MAG: hypothetical protein NVSMB18_14020 [Acetobacteraceae bacterium]